MMKKILTGIGVLGVIAGIIYASRAWNNLQVKARTAEFNEDVENIFNALQKYKERVGSYPVGSNAEVGKSLNGSNPKGVTVIVGRKTKVNDKNEFTDPWGTPLRIYFDDKGVLIRSAGPNRRFDDSTVIDFDDFIRSN
jgi:hypothetical protein